MKKLLSASLVIAIAATGLFANGQQESGDSGNEPVVLTIWDDKSNDEEASVISVLVDQWNATRDDIKLERDSVGIESYKMKIKTAIAANEAPDIFYSQGGGFSLPFVQAEKVLALDEYLSDGIRDRALEGTWTYSTYDNKVYGLPIGMWSGVLYCNTELFDKMGFDIPQTYEELLAVTKAFRDAGQGALGVGSSDAWTAMFYHNVLALQTAGADKCNEVLAGNGSFNEPEFHAAAEKLSGLIEADAFNDGYTALNYDEFTTLFLQGMIPMIYQGDWLAGSIEGDDSAVKGKVKVVNFPTVEGGKGSATEYLGGAIDVYMVSSNTEHREAAVEVLEYIAENYSTMGFYEGKGFPVYEADIDYSRINDVTKQILELSKSATGYVLAWDTFLDGKDAQDHLELVQGMFSHVITPEEFTAGMAQVR